MRDLPGPPRPPAAGDGTRWQVAAVVVAITGVLLLAVAAFVVSYAGIRQIAVAAGVPAALAGLYPVIVDAVLVVACVAALALRGAGWPARGGAWLSVLVLFAAVAAPWWPWAAEPGTADAAAPLPARPEQASGGADPGTADDMLPARPESASSGAE